MEPWRGQGGGCARAWAGMPLPPPPAGPVIYPTRRGRLTWDKNTHRQCAMGHTLLKSGANSKPALVQGGKGTPRSVTEAGAWLSNSARLGPDRTQVPVGGKRCPEDTANGNEMPSLEHRSVVPAHGRSSEKVRFLPGKPDVFEVAWHGQGSVCLCWDPPPPGSRRVPCGRIEGWRGSGVGAHRVRPGSCSGASGQLSTRSRRTQGHPFGALTSRLEPLLC